MTRILIIFMLLALVGCNAPTGHDPIPDQKLRHQYFMECLKALPAGPQQTHYNDWDEVVSECGNQAYYQSLQLDGQPKQ